MSPYEDLAELDLHLGEREARVLEGIDGESLVVLRLHVPVTESLAELDLLLVSDRRGSLMALKARVLSQNDYVVAGGAGGDARSCRSSPA